EDRLDGVQAVFGLVEDDAGGGGGKPARGFRGGGQAGGVPYLFCGGGGVGGGGGGGGGERGPWGGRGGRQGAGGAVVGVAGRRTAQTSLASPIDAHASVWMKSTRRTAAAGSSVMVIRAPVRPAIWWAMSVTSLGGCSSPGPERRTSLPISAPVTSSERPMLNRQ